MQREGSFTVRIYTYTDSVISGVAVFLLRWKIARSRAHLNELVGGIAESSLEKHEY